VEVLWCVLLFRVHVAVVAWVLHRGRCRSIASAAVFGSYTTIWRCVYYHGLTGKLGLEVSPTYDVTVDCLTVDLVLHVIPRILALALCIYLSTSLICKD